MLRVFLRYLHRERLITRDLSLIVEAAPCYRLADLPRSITAEEVQKVLDSIDRQNVLGRRDYAMLLLLVIYGLRAREVAALSLDDIEWRHGSHTFRHSCVQRLVDAGWSLKAIGDYVGHAFNQLLGIVTRFFDWLIARDLMPRSPVQTKPRRTTATRLPFLFDPPTARRLLNAAADLPDTRNTPRRGLTYRTIFALLYGLGLRVGEAARLRIKDIDLARHLLIVRETKFAKSRLVPFGPRIGELVSNYLGNCELTRQIAPPIADLPVFTFRKRQPISPCTISTVFHELASQLALPVPDGTRPPCVHSLRHSFAVGALLRWYRDGAVLASRLPQLSTFMGHVNPRSTAVYLTITTDLLTEASQRFEHWAEPLIRRVRS